MESNQFELIKEFIQQKVKTIQPGDRMAGRHSNTGDAFSHVKEKIEPQETHMDMILDKTTNELYTVHYIKKATFLALDVKGFTRGKEYYIVDSQKKLYVALNDENKEVLIPQVFFDETD